MKPNSARPSLLSSGDRERLSGSLKVEITVTERACRCEILILH